MIKLSDEAINEAFDGDFGEVPFDHMPTPEDIMLLKLRLVARKSEQEILRQVIEFIEGLDNGTRSSASWREEVRKFRKELRQELKKQAEEDK